MKKNIFIAHSNLFMYYKINSEKLFLISSVILYLYINPNIGFIIPI